MSDFRNGVSAATGKGDCGEGRAAQKEEHPQAESTGRPSAYTLESDEARIAALDDACGVNLPEEE